MQNIVENKDSSYIIIKPFNGRLVFWQSPRGLNADRQEERWSLNPYSAHRYDRKSYAESAIERMKDTSPNEFRDAQVAILGEIAERFYQTAYYNISQLLSYHPKAKRAYVLEGNQMFFFATPEERDCYKQKNEIEGKEYEIKLV